MKFLAFFSGSVRASCVAACVTLPVTSAEFSRHSQRGWFGEEVEEIEAPGHHAQLVLEDACPRVTTDVGGWERAGGGYFGRSTACAKDLGRLPRSIPANSDPGEGAASGELVPSGGGPSYRSVLQFGAVGDGRTDDSAAIEKAFMEVCGKETVWFPSGRTFVGSDLDVPSNCIVRGDGATLKLESSRLEMTPLLDLGNSKNVEIIGLIIDGNKSHQMLSSTDFKGQTKGKENGGLHGIRSYGASDIRLRNMTIRNNFTDGFYIGPGENGAPSRNIVLHRVTFENNRRQGVSIVHAEDVLITASRFEGTRGQRPEAGIDIEPNRSNQGAKNIRIENSVFSANKGAAILLNSPGAEIADLTIEHSVITSQSGRGVELKGGDGALVRNILLAHNRIVGNVTIGRSRPSNAKYTNIVITDNIIRGELVAGKMHPESSILVIENCNKGRFHVQKKEFVFVGEQRKECHFEN